MEIEAHSKKKALTGIVVIVFAFAVFRYGFRPTTDPSGDRSLSDPLGEVGSSSTETSTTNTMNNGATLAPVPVSKEKTVTTASEYDSPAGKEKVGFTVIVDDSGMITRADVDVLGSHQKSIEYQSKFANSIGSTIQGKKLADLSHVDTVGGASLTTNAFNIALDALKKQLQ